MANEEAFSEMYDGIYKFIVSYSRDHWMTIMTDMEAEHPEAFEDVKAFFAEPDNVIPADHMDNEALGDIVSKVMFGFLVGEMEYESQYVDDGDDYNMMFPESFGADAVERDGGVANVILDLLESRPIRSMSRIDHNMYAKCSPLVKFVAAKLMEHVINMPPILCKNGRPIQIDSITAV